MALADTGRLAGESANAGLEMGPAASQGRWKLAKKRRGLRELATSSRNLFFAFHIADYASAWAALVHGEGAAKVVPLRHGGKRL